MTRLSKRDILIDTARDLFIAHGFHAVGVDTILKKAGISKRTLYKYFRSKEDLILAVIRHYDETFRNYLMREVEAREDTAAERLLAIFDVAEQWFSEANFHGCIAVKAIGEYSEKNKAIQRACEEFIRLIGEYMEGLATQAGVRVPQHLAGELVLLFEGAIVMAVVSGNPKVAQQAKAMAQRCVVEHLSGASRQGTE
ncbi:MAG: TetR/AcrR family transcriptional regulator [Nitrospinota bacterium]|nr:TetR/AcrR family transcriptional regulator [Nitrospinota bacterium]